MKPIAIIQHKADDAPAYFTEHLAQKNIPWKIFHMHLGELPPDDISYYSGLCVLGGTPSANDPLPYMPRLYALLRDAIAQDIPVIGHCLGGQMLAIALGGTVQASPQPEIGWMHILPEQNDEALRWFGTLQPFHLFHWHVESFSIPAGATLLATTPGCPNQAYSYGKHIGMQFHCEVSRQKILDWLSAESEKILDDLKHVSSVQSAQTIRAETDQRIVRSQSLAAHIYDEWLRGLKH